MKFLCKNPYLLFIILFIFPATIYAQDYTILRVENVRSGWNKLKLGNNPSSFWTPKVDVTANGNTHLTLEFRITEGTPDISRIQIRPNGYSGNPVNIAPYLPAGFTFGYDWYTISIPLTDFDSGIDFTGISLLQFPYSNNTTTFSMEIRSITFTGGTTPYVYFGDGKRDNIHDGNAGSGQMVAALEKEFYFDFRYQYPGETTAKAAPNYIPSSVCQNFGIACVQDEELRPVTLVTDPVVNCRFVAGTYQASAILKNMSTVATSYQIPAAEPLSVQNTIVPPTATESGTITSTISGGSGGYVNWSDPYAAYNVTGNTANYQWARKMPSINANSGNVQYEADMYGNTYFQVDAGLEKYDTDGNLEWILSLQNHAITGMHVSADESIYLMGMAFEDMQIGSLPLGNDQQTFFIARVTKDAEVSWLRRNRHSGLITGDGAGHLYIIGQEGLQKFTIGGDLIAEMETRAVTGNSAELIYGADGYLYMAIFLIPGDEFGGFGGIDIVSEPNATGPPAYLVKVDTDLNVIWGTHIPFTYELEGLGYGNRGIIYVGKTHYYTGSGITIIENYLDAFDTGGQEIFTKLLSNSTPYSLFRNMEVDFAGNTYISETPNSIRKYDPLGNLVYEELMETDYFYAGTPQIALDGRGNLYVLSVGDYETFSQIPDLQPEETYMTKLSAPNVYVHTVPAGFSDFMIRIDDARGKSVQEQFSFTTTAIAGVTAGINGEAYEINWVPPYGEVKSYEVYRKTTDGYTLAGTVSGHETSFTDHMALNEGEKPQYAVKAITGYGENMSKAHSPAVLNAYARAGGKVILEWQPYEGYDHTSYTIYRGTSTFDMEAVGKVNGGSTSFTDKLPASGEYIYRLEASGKPGISMSNAVAISSEQEQANIQVWPNPATDIINCRFENRSTTNTLQITDISGRLLAEFRDIDPMSHSITRGELKAGVYLLTFEDAKGKTTERVVFR